MAVFIFFLLVSSGSGEDPPPGMIFVPGGSYQPLSSDSPLRLDPFYLDRTEVTQKDYEAVMGDNPSYFKGPDRPVEKVTWFDAREYCRRVDKRLPTEWEWEKAIRAGRDTRYFWGEAMDDAYAWYKGNADKQTHPVGRKKPNPFGLYDMAGNVWEWTASFHAAGGKIVRGGSWRNSEVSLTSGKRIPSLPIHKFHYVGFRCARSAAGAD